MPQQMLEREKIESKQTVWDRFRRFSTWLSKEEDRNGGKPKARSRSGSGIAVPQDSNGEARRPSRAVVPGMPRPGTFRRQESERREHLTPYSPDAAERRAQSADRRRAVSARRPPVSRMPPLPSVSAPEVNALGEEESSVNRLEEPERAQSPDARERGRSPDDNDDEDDVPPAFDDVDEYSDAGAVSDEAEDRALREELETRWILNLSMHFRDKSEREKFFITYAETPHHWRRVTISCDYRHAEPASLEADVKALKYQFHKCARIYEAIRESLQDIKFFNTVTNLKLETREGRLHVHVTEDVNEIISYPPVNSIRHITTPNVPRYRESMIGFEAHLSGYVYRVRASKNATVVIKKEIPGPESVDEFLYELNALNRLQESESVVRLVGIVVDDAETMVKGLLISYAEQGALVDMLYEERGQFMWSTREKWAYQVIQGLSEIHEAGFVQGDLTLSNVVIDRHDDAKIIDINRRGCPMGWEPPEVADLIGNGQRVSIYIGVKSDLFQLGMVLWAMATQQDEPEVVPRPLSVESFSSEVPQYFRDVVSTCLSERPQGRIPAKQLLDAFPEYVKSSGTVLNSQTTLAPPELDPKNFLHPLPQPRRRPGNASNGDNETPCPSSAPGILRKAESSTLSTSSANTTLDAPVAALSAGASFSTTSGRSEPKSDLPDLNDADEPQIISVSPSDERHWEEVEIEGAPFLIDKASAKSCKPVDEDSGLHTTLTSHDYDKDDTRL